MSENTYSSYYGRCHCGNISYRFDTYMDLAAMKPRQCQCEFCLKYNNLYQSDPDGRLQLYIRDTAEVSRYQFGHKTADFLVCRQCGVMPVVTSEIEGALYSVVNVNSLEPRLSLAQGDQVIPVVYGDERQQPRLARRQQRWIGNVTVTEGVTGNEHANTVKTEVGG